MLVCLAYSHKDFDRASELLAWIGELDDNLPGHRLLLVAGAKVDRGASKALLAKAGKIFVNPVCIAQRNDDDRGWPFGPNLMFQMAVAWVKANHQGGWLWLEPDMIPLRSGWLGFIANDYREKGRPFFGAVYDRPFRHLNGGMVYPDRPYQYNPFMERATKLPWDLTRPELTMRFGHHTHLMQRSLADPVRNTPHTFPDWGSLSIIRDGAVLFHGCKDGSLTQRLRERHESALLKVKKTSVLKRIFRAEVKPAEKPKYQPVQLPNVTLWAACWGADTDLYKRTLRVLRYCSELFRFERIILFAYLPLPIIPDFAVDLIQVPKLDMAGWNILANRIVPLAIHSDYAMSVHEDGFPLDPAKWNPEFLSYDYIGAPWRDGVVGNGGFNIESQKLLQAKLDLPFYQEPVGPSDYYVCRVHRARLEKMGIRFAPRDLALEFSTETVGAEKKSFGYHGRRATPEKYAAGWKLIESQEAEPVTKVAVVYIYVPDVPTEVQRAKDFVASYKAFPPLSRHRTVVVIQGREANHADRAMFADLPDLMFFQHDDSGHDIGGYLAVAKVIKDDVMVCFGGSSFFQSAGWLARMMQVWKRHGFGLYGAAATYEVSPHINTTGFWCAPSLMASYPIKVTSRQERYDFEHGPNAFWKLVEAKKLPVKLVTWDGEWDWDEWRKADNIFRRGNQSNCIACWHHHHKYWDAPPNLKAAMERNSDTVTDPLFKDRLVKHNGGLLDAMQSILPKRDLRRKSAENFVKAHKGFA